jgi:hypothetical protein
MPRPVRADEQIAATIVSVLIDGIGTDREVHGV